MAEALSTINIKALITVTIFGNRFEFNGYLKITQNFRRGRLGNCLFKLALPEISKPCISSVAFAITAVIISCPY
jgi:hypothetical protein